MMRWSLKLLIAASIAALAAVAWKHSPRSEPVSSAEPKTLPGPARLPEPQPAVAAPKALPPVEASKHTPAAAKPSLEAWGAAFSSQQPVAEVLRLRNARTPGSFAISSTLARVCNTAWLYANAATADPGPSIDPMAHAEKQPLYAERLQAQAKITTRCAAMRQYLNLTVPLPDDRDGIAFKQAYDRNLDVAVATQRAIGQELARQGSLNYVRPAGTYWNGQDLGVQLLVNALDLARLLATAAPGGGADDIRLLSACVTESRCTADYTESWFMRKKFDPAERRQVEAIAQEMAAAMRAGDYEKFLQ